MVDVPGATVSCVAWDGETPWTAAALLQAEINAEAHHSVIDDASIWLRQTLAAGPNRQCSFAAKPRHRGSSRRPSMRRKAEDITVTKERTAQGRGIWSLSDPTGESERERTREGVTLPGS